MQKSYPTVLTQILPLLHQGKVRDNLGIPGVDDQMLMIATDRISAYDVVMKDPIPGKGAILTQLSLFWFDLLSDVKNHLITADVAQYPAACHPYAEQLRGRSMLVRKMQPLPVECIVRGYISGSLWDAYCEAPIAKDIQGSFKIVLGHRLPLDLQESEKLPNPIFTPSTKAAPGMHDENITFAQMTKLLDDWLRKSDIRAKFCDDSTAPLLAIKLERLILQCYQKAADYAFTKNIIIADTKFEVAIDEYGSLVMIDEILTPDSSRFWPLDTYEPGRSQESYDKQFLRDYLKGLIKAGAWSKDASAPKLPPEIIEKTRQRYEEALRRLTS
ncbi:MAG: phosphoribosylaminoimidazolesuccinocarboxamide synthase [Parcubacteria group bacterium]|jgi:phosphoribosylaminoimidazole-succinocarboxamide synthase